MQMAGRFGEKWKPNKCAEEENVGFALRSKRTYDMPLIPISPLYLSLPRVSPPLEAAKTVQTYNAV